VFWRFLFPGLKVGVIHFIVRKLNNRTNPALISLGEALNPCILGRGLFGITKVEAVEKSVLNHINKRIF